MSRPAANNKMTGNKKGFHRKEVCWLSDWAPRAQMNINGGSINELRKTSKVPVIRPGIINKKKDHKTHRGNAKRWCRISSMKPIKKNKAAIGFSIPPQMGP